MAKNLGTIVAAHGWQQEVERDSCTVKMIEQLLANLGEPLDGPEVND